MTPFRVPKIGLFAVLCCTVGFVTPVFAQAADEATVSCGQFISDHRFGETDFQSKHQDFNQCAEMTPPGLTLVDVQGTAIGSDGNNGVNYAEVCQCTKGQ